jgi:magnesium-transporting ATPase (P-type)
MFVLRVNLLAPRKKKRTRKIIKFLFLKHIIEIILIALCVASAALLLGLYILEINFSNIAQTYVALNPQSAKSNQEAVRINKRISQINEAQNQFVPWGIVFSTITEITPENVSWNSWTFDRAKGEARLSGLAFSRESVVKLEEELRKQVWIEDIKLPLADIVAIKDKPFEITLVLLLKKLDY